LNLINFQDRFTLQEMNMNIVISISICYYYTTMNTNTETGEVVGEVVVMNPYALPSKEKLVRMRNILFKLMRLIHTEEESDFKSNLITSLIGPYSLIDSAEKGETNVGRNSSYPE